MQSILLILSQIREEHEITELLMERSELADALLLVSGSDVRRQHG